MTETGYRVEHCVWQPVVDGQLATAVHEVVIECVRELRDRAARPPREIWQHGDEGLYHGESGFALLWYYLLQSPPILTAAGLSADEAHALLDAAIDSAASTVGTMAMPPWLSGGVAGSGWLFEHLAPSVPEDIRAINEEIDDLFLQSMRQSTTPRPYELLRGLAGVSMYLTERPSSACVRESLESLVAHLRGAATNRDGGLCWITPTEHLSKEERERNPAGFINAGAAHGVAGAIGALGRVYESGNALTETGALLEGAVEWMLGQRDETLALMHFPAGVAPDGRRFASTISWCYGDLGFSCALLSAARATGRRDWETAALDIARRVALLPLGPGTARRDPSLCHGTSGIAHMFARFFNATGEEVFLQASRRWVDRTLSVRQPGRFIAGFGSWRNDIGWVERLGLLDGAIGVTLALLSAIAPVEPVWDRLLVLPS